MQSVKEKENTGGKPIKFYLNVLTLCGILLVVKELPFRGVEHFGEGINTRVMHSSSNELSTLVSGEAKCKQTMATT